MIFFCGGVFVGRTVDTEEGITCTGSTNDVEVAMGGDGDTTIGVVEGAPKRSALVAINSAPIHVLIRFNR
jgi:hypothetical protein